VPNRAPKQADLTIVRAAILSKFPWVVHGFSRGGSSSAYGGQTLNLGFTPDDSKAAVERNRAVLARTHRRQPSLAAN
jgi:polyphenol oxidase